MDRREWQTPLRPDGGRVFETEYHNEAPVQAIVRALSVLENCSAESVPPLYQYADPDAMNRLMEKARDSDQEVSVDVLIEDYDVSINSDGTISIHDPEPDTDSEDFE